MQTRSQSKAMELEVNIDFDTASLYWNANKTKLENCCYQYVCGKQLQNGEFCKKKLYKHFRFCFVHKKCV
jgi:hypothetical protein